MGTEITATVGHALSDQELLTLPDSLNAHFDRQIDPIHLRRQFSGEVVDHGDKWSWDPDFHSCEDQGIEPPQLGLWCWRKGIDGETGAPALHELWCGEWRVEGPFHLTMTIGKFAAQVRSDVHWQYLVFDPIFQPDFRRLMKLLADFYRSPVAAYMPDDIEPWCHSTDLLHEGRTFEEIMSWLGAIRPPAQEFEDLIEAVYVNDVRTFDACGYLVDDFTKLPPTNPVSAVRLAIDEASI